MNRISIDVKMKRLALAAAALALLSALVTLPALTLIEDLSWLGVGIGVGISAVVTLIAYLIVRALAVSWSAEIVKSAAGLAASVSAMAVGNLNVELSTGIADEVGQVEDAMAQLHLVQKEFADDIAEFAKRHAAGDISAAISDKNYVGEYKNMVVAINATVAKYADSAATTTKAIVDFVNAGTVTKSYGRKSEAESALEELHKKFEATAHELKTALSAAETLTRDLGIEKERAEQAKREASLTREEAATARREISAANAEAATARREAEAARRETARANTQLKYAAQRTALPVAQKPARVTPSPLPVTRTPPAPPARPTPPSPSASAPSATRLRSGDHSNVPTIKSIKISAPSGAHEYDRKDMGKF